MHSCTATLPLDQHTAESYKPEFVCSKEYLIALNTFCLISKVVLLLVNSVTVHSTVQIMGKRLEVADRGLAVQNHLCVSSIPDPNVL